MVSVIVTLDVRLGSLFLSELILKDALPIGMHALVLAMAVIAARDVHDILIGPNGMLGPWFPLSLLLIATTFFPDVAYPIVAMRSEFVLASFHLLLWLQLPSTSDDSCGLSRFPHMLCNHWQLS